MKLITKKDISALTVIDVAALLNLRESAFRGIAGRAPDSYHTIELRKKSGKVRHINAPNAALKKIQRLFLDTFLAPVPLLPSTYGFTPGKSIIENANAHVKSSYLLNADIVDFFPSVRYQKICQLFCDMGFNIQLAKMLTRITTLNGSLPQGAPTSPYLATLALRNLDARLLKLCRLNRLTYTRYFDDITISGGCRAHDITETVDDLIRSEGYAMHRGTGKFALAGPEDEKCVTGIVIAGGVMKVRDSRLILQYVLRLQEGLQNLKSDNPGKERESLFGKISFIAQVEPELGVLLREEFAKIRW